MPYNVNQFSPMYGGMINSTGDVVNFADAITQTGQLKTTGGSAVLTFQQAATAIGNGTSQDVSAYGTVVMNVVFSGTATVVFEGSVDGTNWDLVNGYSLVSGFVNIQLNTLTSNSRVRFPIAGIKFLRARISAYTSGTVDVTGQVVSQTLDFIQPTINTNADSTATGYYPVNASYNYIYDGTTWSRVRVASIISDGNAGSTMAPTSMMAFAGASFDRVRVGKIYKYIEYLNLPTATSATIWTPAAGKKFRLMGVMVTTSATVHLHLRDATTIFHTTRTLGDGIAFDFGNGYLSAAANNVLEIRNDSGTTTNVWVTAWGTEE